MDSEVTRVLEGAVARVSGLRRIQSSSEENNARLRAEHGILFQFFNPGTKNTLFNAIMDRVIADEEDRDGKVDIEFREERITSSLEAAVGLPAGIPRSFRPEVARAFREALRMPDVQLRNRRPDAMRPFRWRNASSRTPR